jgi:hypothetical protein
MKITRRILKFFGGNWGKPNKVEKKVKLPNPLFKEKVKAKTKKKRIGPKKDVLLSFTACPFCKKELKFLNKEEDHWLLGKRQTWCNECGASWVPECPACKLPTWLSKEGIYKHNFHGCGFTGKKETKHGKR